MAEYPDMLNFKNNGEHVTTSQIVWNVWIDLWKEAGNTKLETGENSSTDNCKDKLWTRKMFLERIVIVNDEMADSEKGAEAAKYKIGSVENLKSSRHGGQPRITQAFNHARSQLASALGMTRGDIAKRLKQPPLEKRKTSAAKEYLGFVLDAGLVIDSSPKSEKKAKGKD